MSRRRVLATVALATALAVAAGCSGGSDTPSAAPTSSSAAGTPTAPPTPTPPPPGACYALDFAAAVRPTTTAPPVPCTSAHTAATILVGDVRPVADGHLLAVDSDTVQRQVADRCRTRFARYVGGDTETQRLSRLTVVWFTPTLADSDRGALWLRCDVVALAGHDRLAPLPRRVRGLLASKDVLDTFGTCGTASPSARTFARVICSRKHSWRARATIDLPRRTRYLSRSATADADSACHDIDARLAADVLRLRWSFEWPTRQQWAAGQRYGFCWTPDPA